MVKTYRELIANGSIKDNRDKGPVAYNEKNAHIRTLVAVIWCIVIVIGILCLFTPLGNVRIR